MRTTVELPEDLFRRARMAAAEQGTTLKDLFARALEDALDVASHRKPGRRAALPQVRVPRSAPILHLSPSDLAARDAGE